MAVAPAVAQSVQHPFPPVTSTGSTANATVIVTPIASGTHTQIRVLTEGVPGKDFAGAGGTCTTLPVAASIPCTVNITLSPTAPGRRIGAVVLMNGNTLLGEQLFDAVTSGPLAVIQPGQVERIAGNGTSTQYVTGEDGGLAINAHVFLPRGIVGTPGGDFYIADTFNNRIRHVAAASSAMSAPISTYAGAGDAALSGDGSPATAANLNQPSQLALDGAGNLYIADTGNSVIRRVDAATGIITTVAGGGTSTAEGVAATSALLASPYGVALDADGNLYIADTGNNIVRRVSATTGLIATVAGTRTAGFANDGQAATTAQLNQPWGLAFGPDGLLYLADTVNQAVRRVNADGTISTVAGMLGSTPGFNGDGLAATGTPLNFPTSVALDVAGNLYIADSQNNRVRRAKAVHGSLTNALMETVVASNVTTVTTTNGTLLNADTVSLSTPYAIAVDGGNNLYVTDDFNKRVLLVHGNQSLLRFPDMKVGKTSAPIKVHLENDGDTSLSTTGDQFVMSALDPATTCPQNGSLASGDTCDLGVEFQPTTITTNGVTPVGTLTLNSDAPNAPDVVTMTANVLSVEPTTTTLSANPSGSVGAGAAVTFTAFTVQTSGNAIPTGTVTFYDGSQPLGTPVTLTSGQATLTTSSLPLGTHTITAQYSGDDNDAAGTSNTVTETVVQVTNTTVVTSGTPAPVGQTITFTATVSANTAVTTGTVSFYDGTSLLGQAVAVGPNSKASFSISTLTGGAHSITAKYSGDTSSAPSTSAPLSQVITKTASSTTVSGSPTVITVGNTVTMNAVVTSTGTGPAPTGNVIFNSGSTMVGKGAVDSTGHATASTTALVPTSASITAVYGGDDFTAGSTSPATSVTVNKLLTTTTLASSGSPANAGSPVVLSATVALSPGQTAVGAISGAVSFYDGTSLLGTGTIASGSASLSTTALTVGSHSIIATFKGNTNYDTSSSSPLLEQIVITSSTTTLSVSAGNLVAGNAETLTATVTATGTVKPTGTVTFTEGSTTLGSAPVNATTGQAALPLATLAPGSHTIVATYGGNSDYSGSTSAAATVTVRIGSVSVFLSATPVHLTYGTPVAVAIKLTSDGILPANPVVTLLDNGTEIAHQALNADGTATYTASNLTVGNHSLVAQFAGNTNNAAAQSIAVAVTVDAVSTATGLTSSNLAPTFGDTITLQAAVISPAMPITGNVTFTNGATTLGVAAVSSNGTATLNISTLPVGRHAVVAVYGGDSTHATSTSAAIVEAVTLPTQTTVSSSANPAIAGLPLTLTAAVAGSGATGGVTAHPTGGVTFFDGATTIGTGVLDASGAASVTLSTLSAGTHTITASYAGDASSRAGTSAPYTQTVRSAATQTALTTSQTPSQYNMAVTLSARVTGEGVTPTGTVTFLDGATAIGQATLTNGAASITVATLSPGIHSLTASYGGNSGGNLASISAAVAQQVIQPTSISLVSSNNPALTLQALTLTVTLKGITAPTPTGTVRFLEGARLLGTGTLDKNGNASIVAPAFPAGSHALTAVYGGDAANGAVTSAALSLEVDLRSTQTSLTATAPSPSSGGILSLVAVVQGDGTPGPGGVVTFLLSSGATVGTSTIDANGIATLSVNSPTVTGGTVTASYGGDSSYAPSIAARITLPVFAATNFTLALSPSLLSIPAKNYVTAYLTVASVGGYSDTVQLGCLGLPYAATCTFDNDTFSLPANGSVRVKVVVDTGSPLTAGGSVAAVTRPPGKTFLAILPAGALLFCLLRRRRSVPALFALLLLLSVGGCGTLNQSSTPPGSFTFQISASGKSTGVTLSLPVSLTVTQ